MPTTLKSLCTDNHNPFKLTLQAGANSFRNAISWCYVFEDEYLVRYLHGSELVVTTCVQQQNDPGWLMHVVELLADHKAAGIIVNTGDYIEEVPQDVLDYCDEKELPLLTMPWEINITDLVRTFCTAIINEAHDSIIHDNAVRDALMRKDNAKEYLNILAQSYDIEGTFTVILIYTTASEATDAMQEKDIEYMLGNRIRHRKTSLGITRTKVGIVTYQNYRLLLMNNGDRAFLRSIRDIILDVYREAAAAGTLFIGAGNEVRGIQNISQSFLRAQTAVRMANYRGETYIRFEEMGVYQLLFSVRDDDLLYGYANNLLAPLDAYDAQGHNYLELLRSYIANDRSLEKTAADLYIHRNTVNYQLQKMKQMLGSPLKTLEDLFPYQVALAIRDMESKKE